MILSVHQPQYLPWLGYFDKVAKSDCFVFLDKVQYKHREYQNRNRIRASGQWIWLTVPVITRHLRSQIFKDVRIDNTFAWQRKHYHSIQACYCAAPFYRHYLDFFEDVYSTKRWESLIDLNVFIIKYFLRELNIDKKLYFESELGTGGESTDRIIEICKKLNAGTYLSGSGGRDYLEEEKFSDSKIEFIYQDFKHPVYRQQFMEGAGGFLPYMSLLDLLVNEGPDKSRVIMTAQAI